MAKSTVNKVILLGRLGQDPEVRSTNSDMQIVNLNVATNGFGPKDPGTGQRETVTEWHRCTVFGKTAEAAATYLRKGSLVYLEGRLQTRKWQDQNGQDRWTTEVVCNEMQFIGGRNEGNDQGFSGQNQGFDGAQNKVQNNTQTQQQGFGQPQGGQFNQPPQQTIQNSQPAQPAPTKPASTGFDDFEDDIPF